MPSFSMSAIRTVQSSLRPVDIVLVPFTACFDVLMSSSHISCTLPKPLAVRSPADPTNAVSPPTHLLRPSDLSTHCPSLPPLRCAKALLSEGAHHSAAAHRQRPPAARMLAVDRYPVLSSAIAYQLPLTLRMPSSMVQYIKEGLLLDW